MGTGWGYLVYICGSPIAIAEGARGGTPPMNSEGTALPQCQIYNIILEPLAWTESTTFFQP